MFLKLLSLVFANALQGACGFDENERRKKVRVEAKERRETAPSKNWVNISPPQYNLERTRRCRDSGARGWLPVPVAAAHPPHSEGDETVARVGRRWPVGRGNGTKIVRS